MKRLMWVLGLCAGLAAAAWADSPYKEGEVLVVYKDQQPEVRAAAIAPGRSEQTFSALSAVRNRTIELVKDTNLSTEQLLEEYRSNPRVAAVSPNYIHYICSPVRTPDDPEFSAQWALHNTGQVLPDVYQSSGTADADIDYPEARRMMRDDLPEAVVVIMDTGVDYAHPDLQNAMWVNPGEIPENGVDDDGNGYVDDVYGWDSAGDMLFEPGTLNYTLLGADHDPMDADTHGTQVAGMVGAVADNSMGGCGVAAVKLMAVKASYNGRSFTISAIIAGIDYVITMKNRGVNIVALNASFGSPSYSAVQEEAFAGLEACGIVVCAASGNDGVDADITPDYPSAFFLSNIISVGATDPDDFLADFADGFASNYGATNVDVCAPGSEILTPSALSVPNTVEVASGADQMSALAFKYSGVTASSGLTAVVVDCGLGYPEDFPAEVAGNIALIERGYLYYSNKVARAMDAGAVGAIIYQQATGSGVLFGDLQLPWEWIPTVGVSRPDGLILQARAGQEVTLTCWSDPDNAYAMSEGTSLASPLVAGCIAVLAQHFPDDSCSELIERLLDNVDVLPSLQGLCVTGGRVNLANALDSDGDSLPDWWELQYAETLAELGADGDADGDSLSNLAEYQTATDPTQASSRWTVEAARTAGGGPALQWPAYAGCSYQVLASDSLTTGSFEVVTNLPMVISAETMSWPISSQASNRFYQVRQIWE